MAEWRGGGGGETNGEGAVSLDGDEEDAALRVVVVEVYGEVGAARHADDDLAVDEEPEADGVLPAPEETLGTVNRVKRPVP